MKLTKEGQKAYDKMKKNGLTDEEIAESCILPMEYESEEEKIESVRLLNEARKNFKKNEKNC
jgi:hypothetical protein